LPTASSASAERLRMPLAIGEVVDDRYTIERL
jgi:hypothetical protein